MKKISGYLVVLVTGMMLISFSSCFEKDTTQPVTLSAQEANDLQFIREEEKLAMDIYTYAYSLYGNVAFGNISSSESTHTNRVLSLITKYSLADPVGNNPAGVFTNPDLQLLYNQLKAKVDSSESSALYVGATIEDLDIFDLNRLEKNTQKTDILNVYAALKCGSRNHIRAFVGQLGTYTPQFLSMEEYLLIIQGEHEQCGRYLSK